MAARTARAAWRELRDDLSSVLVSMLSGQQLISGGFDADVAIASAHDVDTTVPILVDGAYRQLESQCGGYRLAIATRARAFRPPERTTVT